MAMKRGFYSILAVVAVILVGCNKDEDIITKQKDSIVKYLTSTRRMVESSEVGGVLEENPAFYTNLNNTAYRHIVNYYEADREEWMEVEPTSVIDIEFNAYTFSGSEPQVKDMYWSNIQQSISAVEASNSHTYDKLIWEPKPLTVRLGTGELISGLEAALVGCRDQDSVQVYITSKAAYGKQAIGSVAKNSPVAWYIKILSVSK